MLFRSQCAKGHTLHLFCFTILRQGTESHFRFKKSSKVTSGKTNAYKGSLFSSFVFCFLFCSFFLFVFLCFYYLKLGNHLVTIKVTKGRVTPQLLKLRRGSRYRSTLSLIIMSCLIKRTMAVEVSLPL